MYDVNPNSLRGLLRPVRPLLVVAVLLTVVSAVASLAPFLAVAELGRTLLAPGPLDEDRLWVVVVVGASALFVRFVAMGVSVTLTHVADVRFQHQVRLALARQVGRVPLSWITGRNSGEIKRTVQDDVSTMHHLVGHALTDLVAAIITPMVAFGYLFWVDWRLALITMATLPVFVAVYAVMLRGYGEKMAKFNAALARINAAVVEFVQGIGVVKTFGTARRAHSRFAEATDDFATFFGDWVRPMVKAEALSNVAIAPVTTLAVVLAGGTWLVGTDRMPAADVLPFALLALGLAAPVLTVGFGAASLRQAREAAARVGEMLAAPALPQPTAGHAVRPEGHRVELRGVRFAYDGSTDGSGDVLHDLNLVCEPGTVTALVGPSGSGKSTIAALIARFHDVTGGEVLLGGADVRRIPTDELYRHLGFVFQQVQLLRTSVHDNIALARPGVDRVDVERVARAAQVHDRILALPGGYDSVVGEDALLSGGEAQRVSIARALLADTPVLVLDEATAFADPGSEAAIQDALSRLARGRTVIVVAHRLETVVGADRIVVLDRGRVSAQGTHEELLAAGGWYVDARAGAPTGATTIGAAR